MITSSYPRPEGNRNPWGYTGPLPSKVVKSTRDWTKIEAYRPDLRK